MPTAGCLRSLAVLTACISILAPDPAVAQRAFPADSQIQRLLDERVADGRVVGVILATRGPYGAVKLFRAGSTGVPGLPLDGDTLFEIGSITKTFTASLLADMVVRGDRRAR